MDDYYELLDVAPDAARDDIKTAYRAKRDELVASDGDQSRAEAAKLNRAWNVLSDPAQRERYDDRLAEYRESDDGDDDDDDAAVARPKRASTARTSTARSSRASTPRTRAEQRTAARQARSNRKPTIVLPDGLTMAPNKIRLSALGFDLMVLLVLFLAAYLGGIKLVDNHFPGERSSRSHLISEENAAAKKVSADKKKASAADDKATAAKAKNDTTALATAKAAGTAARASEKKDKALQDQLAADVKAIDRKIAPWLNLAFVAGVLLVLLYLVPSTAITGQTLGKRLRGIRVVRLDGSRPGWSTALVRFGVPLLVASFLGVFLQFGPLGLAVAVIGMVGWISHPNKQGLHDRLAKTVVVEA